MCFIANLMKPKDKLLYPNKSVFGRFHVNGHFPISHFQDQLKQICIRYMHFERLNV